MKMMNRDRETPQLPRRPARNGSGWRRVAAATACSWAGLREVWRTEAAFRQECWLGLAAIPLGLWLGRSPPERAWLLSAWLLVLVVELLNSAIEATIDRIGPEQHPLSAAAKDAASAAVMVSFFFVALAWGAVAWDRFAPG